MIPIRVSFQPGVPIFEQVVFAARKAVVSGQLKAGDAFPSVRALSTALKINPNTAHKVIIHLTNEGVLEVRPGIGTVVAEAREVGREERAQMVRAQLEQLAVDARRLGFELGELQDELAAEWRRLDPVEEAQA